MKLIFCLFFTGMIVGTQAQNYFEENNVKLEFMRSSVLGGDSVALKNTKILNSVNVGYSKVFKFPHNKLRIETGALLTFYSAKFRRYDKPTAQYYNWKYFYSVLEVPCLFGMQLKDFYFGGGPTIPILVYYNEPAIKTIVAQNPVNPERFGFVTLIPSVGFRASTGYQFIVDRRRVSLELTSTLYKDFWNVNHYAKPVFVAYGLGVKYNFTREPSEREKKEKSE